MAVNKVGTLAATASLSDSDLQILQWGRVRYSSDNEMVKVFQDLMGSARTLVVDIQTETDVDVDLRDAKQTMRLLESSVLGGKQDSTSWDSQSRLPVA